MSGHDAFGSPYQNRVAYQNMSEEIINNLELSEGSEFPSDWEPRLVVHEFCRGDEIPEELRLSFPTVYKKGIYVPRNWMSGNDFKEEKPKMTPPVNEQQQVLMRGDSPIYRNVFFTVKGLNQKDYYILHDNKVTGTANIIKETSLQDSIGDPGKVN